MKRFSNIFYVLIALALVSCRDESLDPVPNVPYAPWITMTNQQIVLDLNDLTNAEFTADIEEKSNNLVASYDLYVSWVSGTTVNDTVFIKSYTEFPASISVSAVEIANAYGVSTDDFSAADRMDIFGVIVGENGVSYSLIDENIGTDLFGNPGQQQAVFAQAFVACEIANADFFTGDYTYTPGNNGVFGVPLFGSDPETVTVEQGDFFFDRVVSLYYLADFGIGQPRMNFRFRLICGDILVLNNQSGGLSCGGPALAVGPTATVPTYDESDDSEFVIYVTDNTLSGCGAGPVTERFFTLTKVTD